MNPPVDPESNEVPLGIPESVLRFPVPFIGLMRRATRRLFRLYRLDPTGSENPLIAVTLLRAFLDCDAEHIESLHRELKSRLTFAQKTRSCVVVDAVDPTELEKKSSD